MQLDLNQIFDITIIIIVMLALGQFTITFISNFNAGISQFSPLYSLMVQLIPLGIFIGILSIVFLRIKYN